MDGQVRDALLALSLTPGLGPTLIRRCIEAMGTADAVLNAAPDQLATVAGIGPGRAQNLRRAIDQMADGRAVAQEKQLSQRHGVTLLGLDDPDYPRPLRHIPDPPPLLYVRGQMRQEDTLAIAVVGTRRCTAYGREQADRLSCLCAQTGLCIVSGGARGIDAVAHHAALRIKGRTIAVVGSGLAKPYPPEHADLYHEIASGNSMGAGAVLSELPMTAPPLAQHFPRRNRIVSGLSLGVLVIEAPKGSGALITARLAAEDHGREVMAVPGRVDSPNTSGCHQMIREGWATLVTGVGDILEALGEAGQVLRSTLPTSSPNADRSQPRQPTPLRTRITDTQRRVLDALDQPRTVDQLAARTGLPVPTIQADITMLQIQGLLTRAQGVCRPCKGAVHVSEGL